MSCTNFIGNDGQLISHDVNSEISCKSSRCSCLACDSIGCFAKRNKASKSLCPCDTCKNIKNCMFGQKKQTEDKPADANDNITKKIVKEIVTRETIESLKKVTETMYEFKSKDYEIMNEIQSKTSESYSKSTSNNGEPDKGEGVKINPISRDVNEPSKNANTAKKLSCQVMDLPYEPGSVLSHQISESNPLSKLNIFKRIKEIYDACSCKVCECITSKSFPVRDEFCKCKPCDCNDCANLRNKFLGNIREIPPAGCPCIRCDRKDCQGIVKNKVSELQICDCKPCDCLQCSESVSKSCSCDPCQCINCKSLGVRKVSLGPVEIVEKDNCRCSPCECLDCKNVHDGLNPNIHEESYTKIKKPSTCNCENCTSEICRLGEIDTCKCKKAHRNNIKFEGTHTNYDINTALIDENSCSLVKQKVFARHDTIALFASLINNYYSQNKTAKTKCKCDECECIVCSCKEQADTSFETRKSFQKPSRLTTPVINACKCTPCECEVCAKITKYPVYKMKHAKHDKCSCDICDCLNCESTSTVLHDISSKTIRNVNNYKHCHCNPCECNNCQIEKCTNSNREKLNSRLNSEKTLVCKTSRRQKRVLLVTPTVSPTAIDTQNSYANVSSTNLNSRKYNAERTIEQKLANCHTFSRDDCYRFTNESRFGPSSEFQMGEYGNYNKLSEDIRTPQDILINCNNEATDSSYTSIQGERISENRCDYVDESSSNQRNHMNKHQESAKIVTSDSDESVPVYWTCRNETNYPNNLSRRHIHTNHKDATRPVKKTSPNSLPNDFEKNKDRKPASKYDGMSCPCTSKKQMEMDEKTQETQTSERIDNAESFISDCFRRYFKSLNYNDHYSSVFSCYTPNFHLELPYSDSHKTYLIEKYICENVEPSYKKIMINHENHSSKIDYERATNIIRDAKAFSLKLINMLESFEKANREFESTSQKFKNLHQSLLDINEVKYKGNNNTDTLYTNTQCRFTSRDVFLDSKPERIEENEPERDCQQIDPVSLGIESETDDKLFVSTDYLNVNLPNPTSKSNIIQQHIDESIHKIETHANQNNRSSNSSEVDNYDQLNSKPGIGLKVCDPIPGSITSLLNNKEIPTTNARESHNCISSNAYEERASRADIPVKYRKDECEINAKQIRHSVAMNKLDTVFEYAKGVDNDTQVKKLEENNKHMEKDQWHLLKKNVCLNDVPLQRNRKVFGATPFEFDIKQAVEIISLQHLNNANSVQAAPRAKEALAKLQVEVTSLLNMPILQPSSLKAQNKREDLDSFYKKPGVKLDLDIKGRSGACSQTCEQIIKREDKEVNFNYEELKKDNVHLGQNETDFRKSILSSPQTVNNKSSYRIGTNTNTKEEQTSCVVTKESSCEALKVRFVGLRRVSDHTVLVRWKLPKQIKDVQGYELLVDGRAVQQILSPARTVAVVSCLPAGRVLLTVRTVTTRAPHAHRPATTIVCHPRAK